VWGGVGSYPLSSQAPTPVEVELGCDNFKFHYFPGWLGGVKLKLKLNSAQLKLEFGLSLAITSLFLNTFGGQS
jgi:hypothetical protein